MLIIDVQGKIMNGLAKPPRLIFTVMLVLIATLNGCSGRDKHTENNFVGKWKSSKVTTPVYLYTNGEWEIMTDEGKVLQYGVWQYTKDRIMWSYKVDDQIGHDMNAILSVTPKEFQLREGDGSITTFSKLD